MDELTKKQRGFVKDYVETENGTQSALKNYNTDDENTAGAIASENLRKPKIIKAIQTIADRIPDDKLHEVLMEGLNAEYNEKPDYAVRHKYLDTSLKLKGAYETDETKNINILMPVLVKFLDIKDDKSNSNGNTDRVS